MLDGRPDSKVVGTASSGPEGVALCARLLPDIVPMDLRMPGGDGVDATRRIVAARGRHPRSFGKLGVSDRTAAVARAMRLGLLTAG
ncbi:response regulator transcription factor [Streptomyces sp. 16-176A]|uniref:response regulator transcription factor n=1 Tax=Streptomyces sp. 16-176A TaxID=2530458 RepID=UPI00345D2A34